MALIIPPGYSNLTFKFAQLSSLGSKPVWSVGLSAPPTLTYLEEWYDWWETNYRPYQDSSVILETLEMRNEVDVLEFTANAGGDVTAAYAPPQIAPLIQKRTNLVGRANRGRMNFVGLVQDGSVDAGGQLSSPLLASIQGICDQMMAQATSTGDELVLFHNDSSDPTIITELRALRQVSTIRRRNRK